MNCMKTLKFLNLKIVIIFIGLCIFYVSSFSQDIDISENLQLEELLNMKVSSASKYEQTKQESPASVTIISSEEIRRYGYNTMTEILNSIKNFYITNDRNYEYLGIRGFTIPSSYDNKILFLLNGHTLNDQAYGGANFGNALNIHPDMIDRIEIVRGPSSSLYGTGAVLAVVDIITKKGKRLDGFSVVGEYGTFNEAEAMISYGKEFENGLDIAISSNIGSIDGDNLYFEEFDSDSTNFGIANRLDWEKFRGINANVSYKNFSIATYYSYRSKGIPTAPWGSTFNDGNTYSIDERLFAELNYKINFSEKIDLLARGYFDSYYYFDEFPYEESNQFDKNICKWVGGEIKFNYSTSSNNHLIAGIEVNKVFKDYYTLFEKESIIFEKDKEISIFSAYIQDTYQPVSDLSITGGLRYDNYSTFGGTVNPRICVIYNTSKDGVLKLMYSTAFRAPTLYELYYDDPGFHNPNPDLEPEKFYSSEIFYEHQIYSGVFASVSVYYNQMHNLIDQSQIDEDSPIQFKNLNRIDVVGAELELNAKLKNDLWGFLSYSYNIAYDPSLIKFNFLQEKNDKIYNSPSHIVKCGISYILFDYFTISTNINYESERKTVDNKWTDDFCIVNTNFIFNPKFSTENTILNIFNNMSASLQIKNLFDNKYKHPSGFEHLQTFIEQSGRTFLFKLTYKL